MSTKGNTSNAFEQLQVENEAQYVEVASDIKSNIDQRRGFWSLIGDILELYIPKVVDTLLGSTTTGQQKISPPDQQSTDV